MDDLESELTFHFDETVARLVEQGWPLDAAKTEAVRRFGDRRRYAHELAHIARARRRTLTMRTLFSIDLRDALRSLRATPVLTTTTVLSLALGIGASAALFSILNALVLRPLPVREPERLALIQNGSWTNPIWEQIKRRQTQLVDRAFAWSNESFDLAEAGESTLVDGAYVSGEMFDMFGVTAALGRALGEADDVRGGGPDGVTAVISHALWQSRFGGARDVIGRRLTINRTPATIVGVAPPGFFGPEVGRSVAVFLPLGAEAVLKGPDSALDQRSNWWLNIMVRLKPGQTADAAATALHQAQPDIRAATRPADWPASMQAGYLKEAFTIAPSPGGRSTLRKRFATPLTIVMVVVSTVLLIACANIVNLMLVRAAARRQDMGVRLALGASRWRLTRQLLLESLLISIAGGAAAIAFAEWSSALLVQQLGSSIATPSLDLSIDWRVLAFTGGVGLATTMLFGLAPAAGLSGVRPNDVLTHHRRGVAGDAGVGLRHGLVITQVALSLALVVIGALFVRTFSTLMTTPLGFNPANLLIVSIDAQKSTAAPEERTALFQRAVDAAAAVHGARDVSASYMTPLSTRGWNNRLTLPGRPDLSPDQLTVFRNAVTPGWFSTYGMRLLAGRDFTASDSKGHEPVVVVNETFVRRFIGDRSPLGQRVTIDGVRGIETFHIVGVTNDAIYRNARGGIVPTLYCPVAQTEALGASFSLTIRVDGDRHALERGVADALARTDPNLAFSFRDYSDQIRASVSQERLIAMLSGFFGVLALLLAGLGLYGVTSYSVNRRRAEIAIRMALGSSPRAVVRLVLGRVGVLMGLGVGVGLGLSLWAVTFIGALLFDLDTRDPLTFAGATLILLAVGLFAGWLPAQRASRLDPTEALRG